MSNVVNIGEDEVSLGDDILVYDDGTNFFIIFDSNGNVLTYDGV